MNGSGDGCCPVSPRSRSSSARPQESRGLDRAWYDRAMSGVVELERYPQLAFLTWNRRGAVVTESEAFALYESGRGYVVPAEMDDTEREFFERLVREIGHGVFLG